MRKLCKHRIAVDLDTTKGLFKLRGPWHYRYLPEEFIDERNKTSTQCFDSFTDAYMRAAQMWPEVNTARSLVRRTPRIEVLNSTGWYTCATITKKSFVKATQRSEYVVVHPSDYSVLTLANQLPPFEFLSLLNDCKLEEE